MNILGVLFTTVARTLLRYIQYWKISDLQLW